MKKERLEQTKQKYKGLEETIKNNYKALKWITWKKWTDSQESSLLEKLELELRKVQDGSRKKQKL